MGEVPCVDFRDAAMSTLTPTVTWTPTTGRWGALVCSPTGYLLASSLLSRRTRYLEPPPSSAFYIPICAYAAMLYCALSQLLAPVEVTPLRHGQGSLLPFAAHRIPWPMDQPLRHSSQPPCSHLLVAQGLAPVSGAAR
ncbi:hypothetical protein CDD82_5714 [Ophiocordyceps australis]|uniref:Uncharacterized protein n=1 Tax=Ophiocordyceps australis TaxID=1399860 RepID=A0A2C5YZ11_9HYPO|nr:hypothetical protein CDD82_5714 [Ophiocordyceps australis]